MFLSHGILYHEVISHGNTVELGSILDREAIYPVTPEHYFRLQGFFKTLYHSFRCGFSPPGFHFAGGFDSPAFADCRARLYPTSAAGANPGQCRA